MDPLGLCGCSNLIYYIFVWEYAPLGHNISSPVLPACLGKAAFAEYIFVQPNYNKKGTGSGLVILLNCSLTSFIQPHIEFNLFLLSFVVNK